MVPLVEAARIVVHCADSPLSWTIDDIRRVHVDENGWDDVGYHAVITSDGAIQRGRPETMAGAHVRAYNRYSLGVCMVGGRKGAVDYTPAQWMALDKLVDEWQAKYPMIQATCGHTDLDPRKTCPNFSVKQWIRIRKTASPYDLSEILGALK